MRISSTDSLRAEVSQLDMLEFSLKRLSVKIAGIPDVYWFGIEGDYKAMVMELLGHSLEDLF